ncbi:MAG: thioredoxin domain-containing protein [Anaerolineales bacterium]
MSRKEIQARRRRQKLVSRLWALGLVTLGALLVALAFIMPLARRSTYEPRTFSVPVNGPSLGVADAPVRVDVWEDFQCPACAEYSRSIETRIISEYVEQGLVLYTYHFFPFLDGADYPAEDGSGRLHYIYSQRGPGESDQAANAAMCAAEQGRFWDYHDILYQNWNGENRGAFADSRLLLFAEDIGLDMTAFEQCFRENRYEDVIQADFIAGNERNIPGTPSVFVNDVRVPTRFEDIAAAIEAALARP